ncbi:MAG: hypothetical protein RL711_1793, partial [Bacteroidota bacterium]
TDSTYTYNPNKDYYGQDTVVFNVCDPYNACKKDTLFITVTPINDALVVINNTVNIYNNNKGIVINYLSNDSDIETAVIASGIINTGKYGKITNQNLTTGVFTYTPNDEFFVGTDTIVYNVCDQGYPLPETCKYDTIFVEITDNNSCPTVDLDGDNSSGQVGGNYGVKFVENTAAIAIVDKVDFKIADIDENAISSVYIRLTNPQQGDSLYYAGEPSLSVFIDYGKLIDGNLFVSFKNVSDTATYKYLISNVKFVNKLHYLSNETRVVEVAVNDGKCTITKTTYIFVDKVDDGAIIKNNYVFVKEDEVATVKFNYILENDASIDADSLYVNGIVTQGDHGKLVMNTDSTFTYTPDKDFNGKDTVVVSVCEYNKKVCYDNYIFIDVSPVVDSLVVNPEQFYVKKGQTLSNTKTIITKNDYNADGGVITVGSYVNGNSLQYIDSSITISGKYGNLSVSNTGVFSYESTEGLGNDVFIFEVCAGGICLKDTLTITVYGVPTGFSPNNDNKNDHYEIVYPLEWGSATLQVYNRWGSLVYEMENYLDQWDGRSNRGITIGNELPDGTYFVDIKYADQSENNEVFSITLLR